MFVYSKHGLKSDYTGLKPLLQITEKLFMLIITYLAFGLIAGILGGLLGIGGGTIMIPGLILMFGLSQHEAQGTALAAMLPPVGLLAVIEYYRNSNVDLKAAAWLAAGLLFGGLLGAVLAIHISDQLLRRIFGVFLLVTSLKILFGK